MLRQESYHNNCQYCKVNKITREITQKTAFGIFLSPFISNGYKRCLYFFLYNQVKCCTSTQYMWLSASECRCSGSHHLEGGGLRKKVSSISKQLPKFLPHGICWVIGSDHFQTQSHYHQLHPSYKFGLIQLKCQTAILLTGSQLDKNTKPVYISFQNFVELERIKWCSDTFVPINLLY